MTKLTPDRNKSETTRAITDLVRRYVQELGFKPVESEVHLCRAWNADVAGVGILTQTEAIRMKLIPRKKPYNSPGYDEAYARSADAYRALPDFLSILVEVKASRADFKGDKKWTREPPANLCYLAVPRNLVAPAEYPAGWGILEYSGEGRRALLRLVRPGDVFPVAIEQQLQNLYAVAIRREHVGRYAALNEERKAQRVQQNQDVSRARVRDAMCAVIRIATADGGSVDAVLARYRINLKSLGFVRGELDALWGALDGKEKEEGGCLACRLRKRIL